MHFESHAGAGWILGSLPAWTDRRLRAWCLGAAILPDIDAVSFLFGHQAYSRFHHTFGHNVWLGAATVALAAWHHRDAPPRRRALAATLVGVAFVSHLLTDAKLSAYSIHPWWPVSNAGYEFTPNLGLGAPINTWLVAAAYLSIVLIALWRRVTPIEAVSPGLDRRIVRALSPRRLACATCQAACSDRCDTCGAPVCSRHGTIGGRFRLACPACVPGA